MTEEKKNYEPVDLSARKDRLLRNVCRCGITFGFGLTMAVASQKAVQYGSDTMKGIRTEVTEGRADNGHWVQFISPKVDKPLKTMGDALKTIGAVGIAGLAGWGLVPSKRRKTMSDDTKALLKAAWEASTRE